jgi:hypothetical protein
MTAKTKYLLPAFVAIFALMFVTATPYVSADDSERSPANHNGKKHMPILVEGFEGSIPITEDSDRQELKSQVTVSLSEAADGLEVYKGHLGAVVNENDDKFLVWLLANAEKDEESGIVTATIYIVDAADSDNTTEISREIDRSQDDRKHSLRGLANNLEKLEEKFSEPTGDEELDNLGSHIVAKIGELKEAHEQEDSDKVQELRQELKDLMQQFKELRSS